MTADPDIMAGMARLKRVLERRIRRDERTETARAARPIRAGELARYDTAALGRLLRPMLEDDGRGWRAIAAEIGVTSPDLSRIMAGQDVSAAKVFAVCDWAGLRERRFYRAPKPKGSRRFTGKALKRRRQSPVGNRQSGAEGEPS